MQEQVNYHSRRNLQVSPNLINCGTTIMLGLYSSYWDMACRKLRIESSVLKYIRPQQVAAIKLQLKGSMDSKFQNAIINETTLASVV